MLWSLIRSLCNGLLIDVAVVLVLVVAAERGFHQ